MKNSKQTFTLDYSDRNFDKKLKDIAALPCKFNDIVIKEFDGSPSDMWKRLRWINHKYDMGINIHSVNLPGKLTAKVDMMSKWCLDNDSYNTTDSIVRNLPNPDKTFINIGCHDLSSYNDPCYPLALNGWGGIMYDVLDSSEVNYGRTQIDYYQECVTPDNVMALLSYATGIDGWGENIDLLKIDIDSNDGEVLRAILEAGYRPKIIDIEINPEFPPPIKFSITNSIDGLQDHGLYGCSCAYVDELATAHGYGFFQLSFGKISCVQDMVLIRLDVMDEMGLKEKRFYEEYGKLLPVSPKHLKTKSGIDTDKWQRIRYSMSSIYSLMRIQEDLEKVKARTDVELEYLLYV